MLEHVYQRDELEPLSVRKAVESGRDLEPVFIT